MGKVLINVLCQIVAFLLSVEALVYADNVNQSNSINVILPATTVSLYPFGIVDQSSLWVKRHIHCQLFRLEGHNVVNDAAEAYKYETPTKLIVKIKKNLKFSNGELVRPQDVVASIDALRERRTVLRNILRWINKIEIGEDNQLIFDLKTAVPQFQRFLTSPHYAIMPESFIANAKNDANSWLAPIGCGEYKINSRDNESITLAHKSNTHSKKIVFWFKNSLESKNITDFQIVPASSPVQSLPTNKFYSERIFDPYHIFLALNINSPNFKSKSNRCSYFAGLDTTPLIADLGHEYKPAVSFFPRGVLGYSETDNWHDWYRQYNKNRDLLKKFSVSFLTVSISSILQPIYEKWLRMQTHSLSSGTIENPKDFGVSFSKLNKDALIFGFKSNYLDGYEYLLMFSEESANPTSYNEKKLKNEIEDSQDINDSTQRSQVYQNLAEKIKHLCLVYPLATIPYKKVFIQRGLKMPGLGRVQLNDYDLGRVE